MTKAINDATLNKAGDIYQYLIALKDCFELNDGDTATIQNTSPFYGWNSMQKTEKLKRLKDIGAISKEKEETFRSQYNRIFVDSYDEGLLLEILDKFTIEDAKTSIDRISDEFSKYVGHIPSWLYF